MCTYTCIIRCMCVHDVYVHLLIYIYLSILWLCVHEKVYKMMNKKNGVSIWKKPCGTLQLDVTTLQRSVQGSTQFSPCHPVTCLRSWPLLLLVASQSWITLKWTKVTWTKNSLDSSTQSQKHLPSSKKLLLKTLWVSFSSSIFSKLPTIKWVWKTLPPDLSYSMLNGAETALINICVCL